MQKLRTMEEWMLDKERQADPASRRVRSGIPSKFHTLGWDDMDDSARVITDEDETRSAKDMLRAYAEDWEEVLAEGDGLVLLGPPGYGKSLGACLVGMHVLDAGGFVRFTTYADLVQREIGLVRLSKEAERRNDWEEHDREEVKLRWIKWQCDLLILDDVGKERRTASDLAADLFDQLVRKRVNDGKVTIITSNLSMSEWSTYNPSMESFLWELGDVLEYVKGHDHRAEQLRPGRERRRRGTR